MALPPPGFSSSDKGTMVAWRPEGYHDIGTTAGLLQLKLTDEKAVI